MWHEFFDCFNMYLNLFPVSLNHRACLIVNVGKQRRVTVETEVRNGVVITPVRME